MGKAKTYAAEFLGTAVLTFMGCGAAVVLGCDAAGGHLAVAFSFGLSVVAMAYTIGNISGCHINPAVSIGMLVAKRISVADFVGYFVSQVLGAVLGAGLLRALTAMMAFDDKTGALGSNGVANAGGVGGALFVEVILTFIFVITILGVTSDASKGAVAGLIIGLTLTFVHIVGIPLTGTSVNPARSIGPALFAGGASLAEVWVFIVGPLAGGALAAVAWNALGEKKAG
jgi:aquaporin Z